MDVDREFQFLHPQGRHPGWHKPNAEFIPYVFCMICILGLIRHRCLKFIRIGFQVFAES